jgi:hypothetical protein
MEDQLETTTTEQLSLADRAKTGELLTVQELAQATGNSQLMKNRSDIAMRSTGGVKYSIRHAAAASLCGWLAHELATGEPMKLTLTAYEAALTACGRTAQGDNQPRPPKDSTSAFALLAPRKGSNPQQPANSGRRKGAL